MQQQQNLILQFEMEKGENLQWRDITLLSLYTIIMNKITICGHFVHDYDDWKEMCW